MKRSSKAIMALARIGRTSAVVEAWRWLWRQDMSQENADHLVAASIAAAHDANIILDEHEQTIN